MKKQNKIFALFIVIVLCVNIPRYAASGMVDEGLLECHSGDFPSLIAAYKGDLKTLKQMKENNKLDVNLRGNYGKTILQCADITDSFDVMLFLIENGSDVRSIENELGKYPPEIVRFLIEKGARVSVDALSQLPIKHIMKRRLESAGVDFNGMNELQQHNLISSKITETARILLENGAKANERVLADAVYEGNLPLVQLLLSYGADVNFVICDELTVEDVVNLDLTSITDSPLKQNYEQIISLLKTKIDMKIVNERKKHAPACPEPNYVVY